MAYGTDIGRQINEKFGYFVRGRQIILVEFKVDTSIPLGSEPIYSAPTEAHTGGLMLEYTAIPDTTELLNETDTIPLDDTLALALVDYCRAAIIDQPERLQQREYYMTRFKNRVASYVTARVGGLRRVNQRNF